MKGLSKGAVGSGSARIPFARGLTTRVVNRPVSPFRDQSVEALLESIAVRFFLDQQRRQLAADSTS